MNAWIPTVGVIIAALFGGGIVRAFVEYARNRATGRLETQQFDFASLKGLNELLRGDLAGVREELAQERARRMSELNEERSLRRSLEDELAEERKLRRALEVRVAELERATGGTTNG